MMKEKQVNRASCVFRLNCFNLVRLLLSGLLMTECLLKPANNAPPAPPPESALFCCPEESFNLLQRRQTPVYHRPPGPVVAVSHPALTVTRCSSLTTSCAPRATVLLSCVHSFSASLREPRGDTSSPAPGRWRDPRHG